jgi:serine/threonine-protein kinase RsbW
VEADAEAEGVTVRILDRGRAVPPEALGGAGRGRFDFDPENLDGVPAGGMGLSLISMLMDEVNYDSRDGQNVLSLVRHVRA